MNDQVSPEKPPVEEWMRLAIHKIHNSCCGNTCKSKLCKQDVDSFVAIVAEEYEKRTR